MRFVLLTLPLSLPLTIVRARPDHVFGGVSSRNNVPGIVSPRNCQRSATHHELTRCRSDAPHIGQNRDDDDRRDR